VLNRYIIIKQSDARHGLLFLEEEIIGISISLLKRLNEELINS
jgi:hypothetical protein